MSQAPEQSYINESERLFDQAKDALAAGNYSEALALCQQLIERGYSGGWELKAQVLSAQGQKKSALETLQELLAIAVNHAKTEENKRDAQVQHVRHIIRAGLFETIPWLVERGWGLTPGDILGFAADECLQLGHKSQGRQFAVEAAHQDHDDDSPFWYIREADGIRSKQTQMRKFTVRGFNTLLEKDCLVPYHVASDTMEQALQYVRELEPHMPELQLVEVQEEEPEDELPWGVYWRGPWVTAG